MNVFEDLIEELKEENLLEHTVIELADGVPADELFRSTPPVLDEHREMPVNMSAMAQTAETASPEPHVSEAETVPADVPEIKAAKNTRDFLRKRAMEEVSSMQMVEHVLSGVEREYMRLVPVPFDDLDTKKALHKFLQATDDPQSPDCSEAEYELLQETQKWYGELSERDKEISVANIRRFCENSRPALSSQALISLARFYRNSPFTDDVRGKFDFVMTRLFSRENEDGDRSLLFAFNEIHGHIKTLYENWSSINLYSLQENGEEISAAVAQFRVLGEEIEAINGFDELLGSGVFIRLRQLKSDVGELFYFPDVLAVVIDTNLKLGNRFSALAEEVRNRVNLDRLHQKYGEDLDHLVSDTIGRTFMMADIFESAEEYEEEVESNDAAPVLKSYREKEKNSWFSFQLLGVNKWLLAATILIVALSVGGFLWADSSTAQSAAAPQANDISLAGTVMAEHLVGARSTDETFYGIVKADWEKMSNDERMAILKKAAAFANERGLRKVHFLNNRGRTVGFAVGDKHELFDPA
ncbi:MAG: hypothetical protein KF685_10695 [Acidobacteria bacterium]|nr:hypothetical protein [Acidobacteriota bacterium]